MGIFGKTPDGKPAAPGAPSAPLASPAEQAPQAAATGRSGACVIGPKTVVKGEIGGDEDVLVEGSVEGQIRIKKNLRVGPSGSVRATIEAQSIVVSGEVIGDCLASGKVELEASGRLTGNIKAPKIVIAEGAMFKGTSDMSSRTEERKEKLAAS